EPNGELDGLRDLEGKIRGEGEARIPLHRDRGHPDRSRLTDVLEPKLRLGHPASEAIPEIDRRRRSLKERPPSDALCRNLEERPSLLAQTERRLVASRRRRRETNDDPPLPSHGQRLWHLRLDHLEGVPLDRCLER